MFINIIDFLQNKFDIKKLISILKSPLIINQNIYEIEYKIFRKKTYIQSFESLIHDVSSLCDDDVVFWLKGFYQTLQNFKLNSIMFILHH